jgi:hypothetical protein
MGSFGLALLLVLGLSGTGLAQVTLELRRGVISPVIAVLDPTQSLAGLPVNPFNYGCAAYLQLFENDAPLEIVPGSIDRDVVRIGRSGQPASSPGYVSVTGLATNTIVVLLEPREGDDFFTVLLDSAQVVSGGSIRSVGPLETAPFEIPDVERPRCGRVPRVDIQLVQPDDDAAPLATKVDVLRRGPLGSTLRSGLWELWVNGGFAPGDSSVHMDSWTVGGRGEVQLNSGWQHWVSLGVAGRLESDEAVEVVDRALGAELRVRIDFLGIDRVVRPFLTQFVPYPMLVLGYDHVERVARRDSEDPLLEETESKHRLRGALQWSVPLLFDSTLRIDWTGHYLLSDLTDGEERLRNLWDVTLEYPLISRGDLVGTLSLLEGRAPPLFRDLSKLLVGLGIRR